MRSLLHDEREHIVAFWYMCMFIQQGLQLLCGLGYNVELTYL